MTKKGFKRSDENRAKLRGNQNAVGNKFNLTDVQRDKIRVKLTGNKNNKPRCAETRKMSRRDRITQIEYNSLLSRQNFRCFGCRQNFCSYLHEDGTGVIIDHDHTTNKVRGLLCRDCNLSLGHIKDNPITLRRLIAYLTYDRAKTYIYIAGALNNPRVPEIASALRQHGYEVIDEWYVAGPRADVHWQEYEVARGRTYAEALKGIAAQNIYMFDRAYIDLADYMVLVMPAGKSSHLELGYALGCNKTAFILLEGEDPKRYDVMANFSDLVVPSVEDLLTKLRKLA